MPSPRLLVAFATLVATALLTGCAVPRIVDDGRTLDAPSVARAHAVYRGYAAVTKATLDSAPLVKATKCATTTMSPLLAMSMDKAGTGDYQTALFRHHGVDEKLRVLWADPSTGLNEHDAIAKIQGNAERGRDLFQRYISRNLEGKSLEIETETGTAVTVAPVDVCRGRVWIDEQARGVEKLSLFHSILPADLFDDDGLTADEVLWMVVWQQGLSEEASGRLRTYIIAENLLAFGIGAIIGAHDTKAALTSAMAKAGGKLIAGATLRITLMSAGKIGMRAGAAMLAKGLTIDLVAAHTRRWGINAVAATAFDEADAWAVRSMLLLGRDPTAGLRLHARMMQNGLVTNPFALEQERMDKLVAVLGQRLPDGIEIAKVPAPPPREPDVEVSVIPAGAAAPDAAPPQPG